MKSRTLVITAALMSTMVLAGCGNNLFSHMTYNSSSQSSKSSSQSSSQDSSSDDTSATTNKDAETKSIFDKYFKNNTLVSTTSDTQILAITKSRDSGYTFTGKHTDETNEWTLDEDTLINVHFKMKGSKQIEVSGDKIGQSAQSPTTLKLNEDGTITDEVTGTSYRIMHEKLDDYEKKHGVLTDSSSKVANSDELKTEKAVTKQEDSTKKAFKASDSTSSDDKSKDKESSSSSATSESKTSESSSSNASQSSNQGSSSKGNASQSTNNSNSGNSGRASSGASSAVAHQFRGLIKAGGGNNGAISDAQLNQYAKSANLGGDGYYTYSQLQKAYPKIGGSADKFK
ncbi:hypothetical protein ABVF11_07450 [Pediococcus argentinicus]|uniref:hypothetical protein n=1 Tax=Pediococcus argentinicus TaxID=480391 RepID=UPI00338E43D8